MIHNMIQRPRRNRRNKAIRSLVQETLVRPSQLIYPLFLVQGSGIKDEIASLPGNFRMSLDQLLKEIESCVNIGIQSFVLFPAIPEEKKDKEATHSWASDNMYLEAIRTIKAVFPLICLMSDVAMDPYSSDGHDGYVENGQILNDKTLPILAKMSVAQAQAGIDYIGPSDMMDGRVGFLRSALDQAGHTNCGIISYTAKYASAYYGPFRDALDSAPKAGDKKTYQMDPANRREAAREAELDILEGADMIMVKPALHYMDIISDLQSMSDIPVAAYHVSGECAMLIAACRNGWLDYDTAMPEVITSLGRAGADVILTYFAKDYAAHYRSLHGFA